MNNRTLSKLMNDYSAGEINEREYREIRSKLIQEIVAGNIKQDKVENKKDKKNSKKINRSFKNKKKKRTVNLQNKRPVLIVVCVLSIVTSIVIIAVLILR